MLSLSKSDFPKCLYLDQNKWIDLSRAYYGKTGGESFRPALDAVWAAAESRKLIVPLSVSSAMELDLASLAIVAQYRRSLTNSRIICDAV